MKSLFALCFCISSMLFSQINLEKDAEFGNNGDVVIETLPGYETYKIVHGFTESSTWDGRGGMNNRIFFFFDDDSFLTSAIVKSPEGNLKTLILKLTKNGALDNTFGSNGILELPFYDRFISVKRQGDKFLVFSDGYLGAKQILRYTSNGILDLSFGVDGIKQENNIITSDFAFVLPDHSFIVWTRNNNTTQANYIRKYSENGDQIFNSEPLHNGIIGFYDSMPDATYYNFTSNDIYLTYNYLSPEYFSIENFPQINLHSFPIKNAYLFNQNDVNPSHHCNLDRINTSEDGLLYSLVGLNETQNPNLVKNRLFLYDKNGLKSDFNSVGFVEKIDTDPVLDEESGNNYFNFRYPNFSKAIYTNDTFFIVGYNKVNGILKKVLYSYNRQGEELTINNQLELVTDEPINYFDEINGKDNFFILAKMERDIIDNQLLLNHPIRFTKFKYSKTLQTINENSTTAQIISPVKQQLQILNAKEISLIEIFSMDGKKVFTTTKNETDVSFLPKGTYVVKVNFKDNKIFSKKIKKE